jgi:hypothetical protein
MTLFKCNRDWCILPSKRPPGWKLHTAGDMSTALWRNPNTAMLFKHPIERAASTTDGSWFSRVIRRMSADVDDARLGLCLSWRLRLCRKLKHRCLLTLV